MATQIDDLDELMAALGDLPMTPKRETAESIAKHFGFPVFSHRGTDDHCGPDCWGGWPHETCRPGDPKDVHVHRCRRCEAKWDENAK